MEQNETVRAWPHGARAWTYVINHDRDGLPDPECTIPPTYVMLSAGSNPNAHARADHMTENSGDAPAAKFIVPFKDGEFRWSSALCVEDTCFESHLYMSKQDAVRHYDAEINVAVGRLKKKLAAVEAMRCGTRPDEKKG